MKQLSTLLLIVCLSLRVFGQQTTMPKICTNPPAGYILGGAFSAFPSIGCLDFSSNEATIMVNRPVYEENYIPEEGKEEYIFNYTDGMPLNFSPKKELVVNQEGVYWIIQKGIVREQGMKAGEYKNVLSCNVVEIIKPETPDIDISVCGENIVKITFLNTQKNRKHGGYRVIWEGNTQTIYTSNKLPFTQSYKFEALPRDFPYIIGLYTRFGYPACISTPVDFYYFNSFKPKITYLESDKANNQIKIKHAGLDNKVYQFLVQEKGKTTWQTLDSTNGTFNNTIKNINLSKNYFFKISRKDNGCETPIESDSVSNIQLGFEYQNKIFWDSMIEQIPSLKGKTAYSLQRDNSSGTLIKSFGGDQISYSFSEDDFTSFYNNSFRLKAKYGATEILSNVLTLPALSNEFSNYSLVSIFPNPSEDFVQLNSTLQLKTVEIVDLQGKIIESQSIENGQVSVKHLPKGKYIFRLYGNDKKLISSKAIIKM